MAESTSRIGGGSSSPVSRGGLDGLLPSGGSPSGAARVERIGAIRGTSNSGTHNGRMPGPGFSIETADRNAPRGTYLDILV